MTESKLQSIIRQLPKMYVDGDGDGPADKQVKSFNLALFNILVRLGLKPLWKPMSKLEPIGTVKAGLWDWTDKGVVVGKRYASYDCYGFCNKSLDQAGWEETIRYFLS